MSGRFAVAETQWRERLGKLRDVVRQELVTRQLGAHLCEPPARILDVGCGQGTQALRLARAGHRVTALDASPDLLGLLRRDLAAAPAEVRRRVRIVHAGAEQLPELFGTGGFDLVLCHGVLMYLDDPAPALEAIARVTAPDGQVSLLVRNGDALAMRPGLLGDWTTALEAFGATSYLNRIGVRARADRLADLTGTLRGYGLELRTWYGVRVFTDNAASDATPPEGERLAALLRCEESAGRTDPYRRVAALLHLIAERRGGVAA